MGTALGHMAGDFAAPKDPKDVYEHRRSSTDPVKNFLGIPPKDSSHDEFIKNPRQNTGEFQDKLKEEG